MSGRRAISAGAAPLSAYSPAVEVPPGTGSMLFISGQVALLEDGSVIGDEDVTAQATACYEAIGALVEAAGGALADVVRTTVYLRRMGDLPGVREARDAQPWGIPPSTTVVGVSELFDERLLVEIDAVAVLRHAGS
jgi:2-iminobutanoate/2-iminopropanoate deaminase